jgi:hypothetical protein
VPIKHALTWKFRASCKRKVFYNINPWAKSLKLGSTSIIPDNVALGIYLLCTKMGPMEVQAFLYKQIIMFMIIINIVKILSLQALAMFIFKVIIRVHNIHNMD